MNTFLKVLGLTILVTGLQGLARVDVQAQGEMRLAGLVAASDANVLSSPIGRDLHNDGYIPPDNGGPDRTQGSGTR